MKLTKTLSAIALALLSYNAFASDDEHEEGEKLYKAQCASCHGATGGMDINKRIAPPIAGVRMHYISAHPEEDAFVAAISGWLANQDETKSLMPEAIKQFKIMPPLEIALEDSEKIAAYIYAGKIEIQEGFEKHVEQMHGKKGMGQGMHGKGMHGKGMQDKGKEMRGKGMHGMRPGMHGKAMPGMMPRMGAMPQGPGMSPAQMSARVMQQFDLSADQMAKMQALIRDKSATMQTLNQKEKQLKSRFDALDTNRSSYKADIFSLAEEQAKLARRMTIEKGEMRYNLDSLLSPEQRQRFSQMRAKKSAMKQRMRMNKGMPQGMGVPYTGMPPMPMPMPQMGKQPMSMPAMKTPAAAPATTAPIPKSE